MGLNWPKTSPNNAAEYTVSAIPWVTASEATSTVLRISFPYVTRFIVVTTEEQGKNVDLRIGFTEDGVNNGNYIPLPAGTSTGRLELRIKDVFIRTSSGSLKYGILGGLTCVDAGLFPTLTGSEGYEGI